jgi:ABC-type sugar transport system ATPase subunit
MSNLSGGNQQKILVSRALMTNCKVLILLEPTRGIDVGAKSQMHQIIHEFAEKGIAVIIVSSDLLEVIQLADRVMVVYNGRSQGFLEGDEINEDYIMLKAVGLEKKNR